MPYTTTDDLAAAVGGAERLVELADWDADGVPDASALTAAQAKADALVNSYAAMRYAVPIAAPSNAIIQVAADETIFQLKLRRGAATELDLTERDVRARWLERLSEGKVRPSDPPPRPSSAVASHRGPSSRDVSQVKTRGYW